MGQTMKQMHLKSAMIFLDGDGTALAVKISPNKPSDQPKTFSKSCSIFLKYSIELSTD